jgi:TonB family protein
VNTQNPVTSNRIAPRHATNTEPLAKTSNIAPTPARTASAALAPAAQFPQALNSHIPGLRANLKPCQLVSSVQPEYPKKARRRHIEGNVKLRVVVGTDGSVRSVSPLGGPPLLIAAAMDATRQFRYKPAQLNGQPIQSIQTIDISFKLER